MLEVLYGVAGACEVAYYTYIYAKVKKEHYKKVTSYTYSAIFLGNLVAAILSQVLVSFSLMDYYELNFISLAGVGTSLILALFLPRVRESIYFYRNETDLPIAGEETTMKEKLGFWERVIKARLVLWKDFKGAYSSSYVLKWSIWWAASAACNGQVSNYIQSLWEVITPDEENESWNGAVGAIQCALSKYFPIPTYTIHIAIISLF
jgi:thiamine transporter 2/3